MGFCAVEKCDRPVYKRKLCMAHERRLRIHGDVQADKPVRSFTRGGTVCVIPKCGRRAVTAGICHTHNERQRRTGSVQARQPVRDYLARRAPCAVEGCGRASSAKGYCPPHYQRWRRLGTAGRAEIRVGQERYVEPKSGYAYIRIPEGHPVRRAGLRMVEHRAVMEAVLGRALRDEETVHHRNGVRDDNRPENLELWSSTHPYGQRVTDLLTWAREIIGRYGAEEGLLTAAEGASDAAPIRRRARTAQDKP